MWIRLIYGEIDLEIAFLWKYFFFPLITDTKKVSENAGPCHSQLPCSTGTDVRQDSTLDIGIDSETEKKRQFSFFVDVNPDEWSHSHVVLVQIPPQEHSQVEDTCVSVCVRVSSACVYLSFY